jgi:hypothetical protein
MCKTYSWVLEFYYVLLACKNVILWKRRLKLPRRGLIDIVGLEYYGQCLDCESHF